MLHIEVDGVAEPPKSWSPEQKSVAVIWIYGFQVREDRISGHGNFLQQFFNQKGLNLIG